MKTVGTWLLAAAVLAIHCTDTAVAAEAVKPTPFIEIVVPIEIQNDWTYRSDLKDNERNDLFAKIEPEATVGLLPGLTLFVHAVLEPAREPFPGEDRFFEAHGLYLEDLYLMYRRQLRGGGPTKIGFALWGGKFTPNFGIAWDAAPGICGTDFAEDYELSERMGFAAALTLSNAAIGEHTLAASTFVLDTSALAGWVIAHRRKARRADGGPSNTGRLSSFHVALNGKDIPNLNGLSYHLAFVHQEIPGPVDENGLAAALGHSFERGGYTIEPLVEFVHFWDADGVAGQRRAFLTTAIQIARKG
jgi:hypothetical protein